MARSCSRCHQEPSERGRHWCAACEDLLIVAGEPYFSDDEESDTDAET